MVNFAIRNDPNARLKFAPLQSKTGQTLITQYGISPQSDTLNLERKKQARSTGQMRKQRRMIGHQPAVERTLADTFE